MEEYSRLLDKHKDIKFHKVPIGEGVKGFIYLSKKGNHHIFVSDSLSDKAISEVIAHEIYHIKNDMPRFSYIIGIDSQHEEYEHKAKVFSTIFSNFVSSLMQNKSNTM